MNEMHRFSDSGSNVSGIEDLLKEISDFESGNQKSVKGMGSKDSVKGMGSEYSINDLISELLETSDNRTKEIKDWPLEIKRNEAADSKDRFTLEVLIEDPEFIVRALCACNVNIPSDLLLRLLAEPNPYMWLILANNPNTTSEMLDRLYELSIRNIGDSELRGEMYALLDYIKTHPNVSEVTKYKVVQRISG